MTPLANGYLKAGLDSVRSAKWRNLWTMLGVIIGVASVISIVGIGEGVKQQISGQIHHLGKNLITVRPRQLHAAAGPSDLLAGATISGPLTARDLATVSHVRGVVASAPLTVVTGNIRGDSGNYNDGFVVGTTPDLSGLLNQSMAYGTFLTSDDTGINAAVLGQHAAEALFNEDVPLGRSFTFHGQEFIVRGIFNEFNITPLSQEVDFNNAIFIPNDVAETLTNNTAPTYEILAKPASARQTAQVTTAITHALDQSHGGQSNLSVLAGNQNLAATDNILDLLTHLTGGVAAISLLVGGIGIMNVMLVSVGERQREIGIRKAVGATNHQVLSQFMVEAAMLSLVGSIIGVALAFFIDLVLRLMTNIQPVISWQIIAIATGVSLVVGTLFGSIPALKAAKRDPIEALRGE